MKRLICLPCALTALALLSGCLQDKQANGPAETRPARGAAKFVVGFAQAYSEDPWRQVQNASLLSAAKSYPDLSVTLQDASNDNSRQISQVEGFLTQHVNLLLISPNE